MAVDNTLPPIEHQVGWLFTEMGTGNGGNIAGTYRNSPNMSVSEATIAFEQQFERSADTVGSSGMGQRIEFANNVYSAYNTGTLSSQSSNVQYVFNQAIAQGYTPQQAAGIAGNLMRESGPDINPYAVNPGDGRDGSNSVGIAQWNSDRANNMLNYDSATGEVVPNEFVQAGDIGADGEPLTAQEAEAIRDEAQAASAVRSGTSYYEPNELNDLESYTYNWAIHMIHPSSSHFPASQILNGTGAFVTLAQSGVENEISIDRVVQTNALTFSRENRTATANLFTIDLTEPAGFTLYNRLLYAADTLQIENYLKACYILELNIRGWRNGSPTEVGPFYYNCMAESIPMQYRDGASFYQVQMYETHQAAFNRLEFHILEDIPRIQARNYGDFLSQFQEIVNDQARQQVQNSPGQIFPNIYAFTTDGEFADWTFDAATGNDLFTTRGISVTGSGGQLDFSIAQGTSITAAMSMALYHTRNFRRLLTTAGFALTEPSDPEADVQELTNLTKWVSYDTNMEFGRFDPLIEEYEKIITYHSKPYIAIEEIHDPASFNELRNSRNLQTRRLGNIFTNGLLRKRYDYIFTGLNTEVVNLNIEFNNAFYSIQALNSGAVKFPSAVFDGSGSETLEVINDLRADTINTRNRIRSLRNEIVGIVASQEEAREAGSIAEIRQAQDQIREVQAQIQGYEEALRILEPELNRRFEQLSEEGQQQREARSLNDLYSRLGTQYITQSQVTSSGASTVVPNSFRYHIVDSLATNGPEQGVGETPIGAAKLGAVEMNLLSLGDMVEIDLDIRGDPYWLGSRNQFDLGGPCYFLNLNFPTYPDPQTGLMSSVGDFNIAGLYRVTEIINTYADGAWTQTLRSFLDTNTNYQILQQELMQGFVQNQNSGSVRTTAPIDADGDGTISNEELTAFENGDFVNPDLIGSDQPGGHGLDSRLDSDLANLLIDSADATGVTLGNRSGQRDLRPDGRDTAGSTSGRHTHGHASDTELYMNGRLLSVNNPADLPYIQNFTREFYNRSRAAGYQPSIGWGSSYMGGNAGHFDIASGENRRPDGSEIAAGYWGNGSSSSGAPAWLRDLYRS